MYKMFKTVLTLGLFAVAAAFVPVNNADCAQPNLIEKASAKIVLGMTLQQTGAGTVQATWQSNEAGPYTVSVFNLVTGQRVQQFVVAGTTTPVTGLTAGVKYRISAAGNINFTGAEITVL